MSNMWILDFGQSQEPRVLELKNNIMKLYSVHCLNIHISLQNIMKVLDPIKSIQLKLHIYKQFCNKPLYLKTLCNSAKINLNIHCIEWKNF